jgi:hypothetical protein
MKMVFQYLAHVAGHRRNCSIKLVVTVLHLTLTCQQKNGRHTSHIWCAVEHFVVTSLANTIVFPGQYQSTWCTLSKLRYDA